METYAGFTRFELELEFVQLLSNPFYLNHLACQNMLSNPAFINYITYLQYWSKPEYVKFLSYPGPTLKTLELLQNENFRKQVVSELVVRTLAIQGAQAAPNWEENNNKYAAKTFYQQSRNVTIDQYTRLRNLSVSDMTCRSW